MFAGEEFGNGIKCEWIAEVYGELNKSLPMPLFRTLHSRRAML